MIISDTPAFICFQPWKCGSTTLYAKLQRYDNGVYKQEGYFNPHLGKISHKHITLENFLRLPESKRNFTRFTFVRNPYDRLYSGFLQRRHRMKTSQRARQKNPGELESVMAGFSHFLEFYLDAFRRDGRARGGQALHRYLYHNNRPEVDFVGFVETFDGSFQQIAEKIGIRDERVEIKNVRYKGDTTISDSKAADVRYRYIDKHNLQTIQIINEIYAKDFECTDYRMLGVGDIDQSGCLDETLSPFRDEKSQRRQGNIFVFDRMGGQN